jgi:hypothetical protein
VKHFPKDKNYNNKKVVKPERWVKACLHKEGILIGV